jgi:hypothetical protein
MQQRSPRTRPHRGPGLEKMRLPGPRYGPIDLGGSIRSDGCTMIPGEQNVVDSLWANPSAPFSLLLSRSSLRRARPMKHRQSTSSAAASPLYLFYPTSEMAGPEAEKSAPPRAPSPARVPTDGSTRRHRVASRWRPTVCSIDGDLTGGPQLLLERRLRSMPAVVVIRRTAKVMARARNDSDSTSTSIRGGEVSPLNPRFRASILILI